MMKKWIQVFSLLILVNVATAQFYKKGTDSTLKNTDSLLQDELKANLSDNIPVVSLDENDLGDGSAQNISAPLTAGRDPFYSVATYNFSAARYKLRGYDADNFGTYMNGVPMENLDNGFTTYGLWGGLNDVMHNREVSHGLRPATFGFGEIGSNTSIDTRASKQRKQTQFGYTYSNRNFTHRWSATRSTGLNKNGWAFTLSGSRRWADEGYTPGTYYNGWSYFVGIDKKISDKTLISLVVFGSPTETGRGTAVTGEAQSLVGHYYNPKWGYWNGKKRNSSVGKTNEPYIILTHDHRFSNKSSIITAGGLSFGERSSSGIDWFNAKNPSPDYYQYLPSYQTDPATIAKVAQAFMNNTNVSQINWADLYSQNLATLNNSDSNGARYFLGENVISTKKVNINSVYNNRINEHINFTGGASYQYQNDNNFKRLSDLLGGAFHRDVNQFAQRSYPNSDSLIQNDLNRPNRVVKVGDRYDYDYDINIVKVAAFSQATFKFKKVEYFLAAELSNTEFWRVGNVRNGLFSTTSYGKSSVNSFTNYAVKGGAVYKIDGRNYLYLNGAVLTKAPLYRNVYLSPSTRPNTQDKVTSENIQTAEGGYLYNSPIIKLRISGYFSQFSNQLKINSFYHDSIQNNVNYAMSNIGSVHYGSEIGFEARVLPHFTINGAASISRYYYNTRQNAAVVIDNDTTQSIREIDTVYSKNYRVGGTPQEAYSLGFTYRSPKYWFVSLTANYVDYLWVDFNPIRRTTKAVENITYKSTNWNTTIDQQRLPSSFYMDFYGGYSWKLPRSWGLKSPSFLVFNVSVDNILNNQNIFSGGFEQLRYDFKKNNADKFPPKYYYAFGLNYAASVTYRF